jgi:DedD protein
LFSLSRWFGGASSNAGDPRTPRTRPPSLAPVEADVEQLRTQARRRLIGAVVLLAIGVVTFPLVFETEPRPIGVDTPMQRVQGADARADAQAPPPRSQSPVATDTAPPAQAAAAQAEPSPEEAPAQAQATPATAATPPVTASVGPAAVPPAVPAAVPPVVPPATLPSPPRAVVTAAPAPALATAPAAPATAAADRAEAQRARALLEGRAAVTTAAGSPPVSAARFVVQVGAFTEPRALRDARQRVERLGLKTYTQVINSPAGPRTRVRVGPFDSRAEADAAGAKLRAAGLQVAILTL